MGLDACEMLSLFRVGCVLCMIIKQWGHFVLFTLKMIYCLSQTEGVFDCEKLQLLKVTDQLRNSEVNAESHIIVCLVRARAFLVSSC